MHPGSHNSSARRSGTNGLAIAGMVLGIIGIFFFSIILGPLAIIFGAVGLSKAKRSGAGTGIPIASIVLGVVDILLFIVLVAVISSNGGFSWYIGG